MKHSKSYKEMKSHPKGSQENPLHAKMGKSEKKGVRKLSVRLAEKSKKHSKEDMQKAHSHMKAHGG